MAARLAEERLAEWRRLDYGQWRLMIKDSDSRQVAGDDGKRYSVVSYALDDGGGRIRMCEAVDVHVGLVVLMGRWATHVARGTVAAVREHPFLPQGHQSILGRRLVAANRWRFLAIFSALALVVLGMSDVENRWSAVADVAWALLGATIW